MSSRVDKAKIEMKANDGYTEKDGMELSFKSDNLQVLCRPGKRRLFLLFVDATVCPPRKTQSRSSTSCTIFF